MSVSAKGASKTQTQVFQNSNLFLENRATQEGSRACNIKQWPDKGQLKRQRSKTQKDQSAQMQPGGSNDTNKDRWN